MQSYMIKVLRVGEPEQSMKVETPGIARRYWHRVIKRQSWFDENKEQLIVLLLSTRHNVEGYSLVSIGSLNESIAHPREIFRAAIASGCYAIVVMHNHPSGDPFPSERDHCLTKRLINAADLLQIQLLDHVIIGRRQLKRQKPQVPDRMTWKAREARTICRRGYFSFKEAGAI